MILVVSSPHDVHARVVADRLRRRGKPVAILDMSTLAADEFLSYPIGRAGIAPRITAADGRVVDFGAVEAIWYRRFHEVAIPPDVGDADDRAFVRHEWQDALNGIFLGLKCRSINPLLGQLAATKPRQLELARRTGLRVPETLITNDPDRLEGFLERHRGRVVHKAMSAPANHFVDTRRWADADRAALPDLPLAPTIFQEEITGPSDVRVTVVGDQLFAARIDTAEGRSDLDSRLDLDAPCHPHALPPEVRERLLGLMRALGLRFGTVDLKITEQGEHVFFEVNPQGQFLYIEILTGLGISAAMAGLLAGDQRRS
ncbi:MvdC/MvdD family ATP grasp protein [Saccharopolyspora shandongensis]|uniref:ATP-grasp domain-containing protein n=1 Tax=Saccharopolyspora shandongensis TaxID=418495 RepID=UPI00343E8A8E